MRIRKRLLADGGYIPGMVSSLSDNTCPSPGDLTVSAGKSLPVALKTDI